MFFMRGERNFSYHVLSQQRPPILQIHIEVRSPQEAGKMRRIQAIIDTGADRTFIPAHIFTELGPEYFEYGEKVRVKGADDGAEGEDRSTFLVHLGFAGCDIHDHEVISLNSQYAVIGRDILNLHTLVLRGPKLKWLVNGKC